MQTALILIDVQQSFRVRPYWQDTHFPAFLAKTNELVSGSLEAGIPIVRILHAEGPAEAGNPFSTASGLVRPIDGLMEFKADAEFLKTRHSSLVGTGLGVWLRQNGIRRLIVAGIRTEQCCETTTRHASDEGYEVDFALEATLTFDMLTPSGGTLTADQIAERTATVLSERFARICTVRQALQAAS